jgi:TonB family protein
VIGALVRWLPLSLALHAGALAATLLLAREPALSPLFVDLTLQTPVSESSPPGGLRDGDGRPAAPRQEVRRPGPRAGRGAPAPPAPSAARPAEAPSVAPPPSATASAAIPPVAPEPVATPPTASPSHVAPPPTPATPADVPPPPSPSVAAGPPAESSPAAGYVAGEWPGAAAWAASAAGGDGGPGTASARGDGAAAAGAGGSTSARSGGDGRATGAGDGVLALAIPGDGGGVYGTYLAQLRRRVQESVTYPEPARRRSLVGTVHLEIALDATGRVAEVTLVSSSSHGLLDRAAMDGVRALRRVPFPSDVQPRPLRVRLPVVFELR